MPSCADESLSIGAAYIGGHMLEKDINKIHPLKDLYPGPIYEFDNLEQIINEFSFDQKIRVEKLDNIGQKIGIYLQTEKSLLRILEGKNLVLELLVIDRFYQILRD